MRHPECIVNLRFSDSVIPAQAGIQISLAVILNFVDAATYRQGVSVLACVFFCALVWSFWN